MKLYYALMALALGGATQSMVISHDSEGDEKFPHLPHRSHGGPHGPHSPDGPHGVHGRYHDVDTAARVARTLVTRESLANLNTYDSKSGYPVGFVGYYADCQDDGNPLLLLVDISSTNKNVESGSNVSLSIRVGDHEPLDHVNHHYVGSVPFSVAGSPRLNLKGHFVKYEATEKDKKCFARRHHDAISWYPGNPIHESKWVKFDVDSVYFVGGFGSNAYIGDVPVEKYLAAEPFPKHKWGHGKGKGKDGEKEEKAEKEENDEKDGEERREKSGHHGGHGLRKPCRHHKRKGLVSKIINTISSIFFGKVNGDDHRVTEKKHHDSPIKNKNKGNHPCGSGSAPKKPSELHLVKQERN
ncbi:DEKNAAC103529 [Brettanomyces naardenensis]|uniref:DEKNAAC103529 n=1 Tax=Brettanomyces naardenensis TaxID=13370 RepID=A0A448YNP3_BRENA|nr:DEKNAAC103529 [Brettanomyces naardenensis]